MAQKVRRPDWRRADLDFPRIFRKSMTNRLELTVPDFWALIATKNASFYGHFARSGIGGWGWGVGNDSEDEAYLAAIRPKKEGPCNCLYTFRDFPDFTDGGVVGVLADSFPRWVRVLTLGRSPRFATQMANYALANV